MAPSSKVICLAIDIGTNTSGDWPICTPVKPLRETPMMVIGTLLTRMDLLRTLGSLAKWRDQ